MPKYRKLYTKTLESLDVNDMPDDFCRLFWTLLPLVLCREGRGLNSATWLKSRLFPLREDVTREQVQAALDWCIGRGMIVTYSVDGRDYFYVPSFHTYQGNTTKEAESNYPPPQSLVESKSGVTQELVKSKSVTDAVFSIQQQYSDAEAEAEAEADRSAAADACLRAVHGLGVKEPKASNLVKQASENGGLDTLVPDLQEWIAHYSLQDSVKNPVGLAISQVESGIPPPGRAAQVIASAAREMRF